MIVLARFHTCEIKIIYAHQHILIEHRMGQLVIVQLAMGIMCLATQGITTQLGVGTGSHDSPWVVNQVVMLQLQAGPGILCSGMS